MQWFRRCTQIVGAWSSARMETAMRTCITHACTHACVQHLHVQHLHVRITHVRMHVQRLYMDRQAPGIAARVNLSSRHISAQNLDRSMRTEVLRQQLLPQEAD